MSRGSTRLGSKMDCRSLLAWIFFIFFDTKCLRVYSESVWEMTSRGPCNLVCSRVGGPVS